MKNKKKFISLGKRYYAKKNKNRIGIYYYVGGYNMRMCASFPISGIGKINDLSKNK